MGRSRFRLAHHSSPHLWVVFAAQALGTRWCPRPLECYASLWIRLDGSNKERTGLTRKSRETSQVLENLWRDFALGLYLCHVHGGSRRFACVCWSASLASRCTTAHCKRIGCYSWYQSNDSTLVGLDWIHRCSCDSRIRARFARTRTWHAHSFVWPFATRSTAARCFC